MALEHSNRPQPHKKCDHKVLPFSKLHISEKRALSWFAGQETAKRAIKEGIK